MLCFTSPTIKIFFPFDMLFKIFSCTKLLSWYSSISISLNWYFFAMSVLLPFSSTNMFKAWCSMSEKSTMFFSAFLLLNSFLKSKIKFSRLFKTLYIAFISEFDSSDLIFIMSSLIFFIEDTASSLIFLAWSFNSFSNSSYFLFLDQSLHSIFCKLSYNLSQFEKSIDFKFTMSSQRIS